MRSLSVVAAGVAAVLLLSGCDTEGAEEASVAKPSSKAAAPSKSVAPFDVDAALKRADASPYSAEMRTESYAGTTLYVVMEGRINFNGPAVTGRLTMKTSDSVPKDQAINEDSILLEDAFYSRTLDEDGPAGEWRRVGVDSPGGSPSDYGAYARLLLGQGPRARKGPEKVDVASAYRISGTLTFEQLRSVDRRLYDRMRGSDIKKFDCDVWVNASGRVVRFEQWMQGPRLYTHNIVTLKKFGAPVPLSAPE